MREFIKTKHQVLADQTQTIEAERKRFRDTLMAKQNEIEALKENLGVQSKRAADLNVRSEILSLWSGTAKSLTRLRLLQLRAFNGLKKYREWKKYKKVLAAKSQKEYKLKIEKLAFRSWIKDYKEWKEKKD